MQIVSFEGIDASGKETQSRMLVDYLRGRGYKVITEAFPRYYQPIGSLIKRGLMGDIDLSVEGLHALLEADRLDFQGNIKTLEDLGIDFLVLDRYTLSNLAFGLAKGLSLEWLRSLQHGIRQPDVTFVMDIPADVSRKRKPQGRDKYELDYSLLNRARSAYVVLTDRLYREDDQLIYLINANADPNDVHESVVSHIEGVLTWTKGKETS